MNALFALEVKNRYPDVDCVSAHPGVVDTDLFRDFDGLSFVGGSRPPDPFGLLPDVDESVGEVASWITPRLGGVGPTTVAMLLRNTALAAADRGAE